MATATTKTSTCPICERPTDAHYRPFCSKRCADVDLARWLSGSYAIPDDEDEDGGDTAPSLPDADDTSGRPS